MVITNKGDAKRPAVRARLKARPIATKYGGKDCLYELFVAMPSFELIKLMLVRVVQGPCPLFGAERGEVRGKRKLLFIDVSKTHLYAPIGEDGYAFVDLPPECSKESICGVLDFWLYGMRPASKGWEDE